MGQAGFAAPEGRSSNMRILSILCALAGLLPFRILDPAANGGKGLVVLNGQQACASLPRSVTIPVRRRAKRAFFLGNVTGWRGDDPGAGA